MKQTGINLEEVKVRNRNSILELLNSRGAMSRKDIAASIGLTPAAVTFLCTELLAEGILEEKGELQEEKRAGRKKVLLDINYGYRYVVSINIESKYTHFSICNLKGVCMVSKKLQTKQEPSPAIFLQKIANECKSMLWEKNILQDQILGIGVCVPGIVNRQKGLSVSAYGIWTQAVNVKTILEQELQLPVIIENNVKAFAEAELVYGIGKTDKDLLFVKWGPGVGSAIVIGNRVYEGDKKQAAEMGHYVIDPKGAQCQCGRKGCLETQVSVGAIIAKFVDENIREQFSSEDDFYHWMNTLTASDLEQGSPAAQTIKKIIERLARAVVNVITILDPAHVVLWGPMFESEIVVTYFIESCKQFDALYNTQLIIKSRLNQKKQFVGGAAVVTRQLFFGKNK